MIVGDDPLVSVIIPFLNPGAWLTESIESVIHQTYENWQLILIDDGSVYEDSATAKGFAKIYPGKIIYVEHENHLNKGLTFSRNTGIANATGVFVAFLDADDCWLPVKLENQLKILNQHPQVEMLCEASCFWYNWQYPEEKNYLQLIGTAPGVYYPPQLMKKLYPLGEGQPPCPSGIIIRRKTLLDIGGFEESFSGIYQLYEDQAFLSKVYSKAVVYISGEANNMYRKREDSMSSAANNEIIYNTVRIFYLDWLDKYFRLTLYPEIKELIDTFRNTIKSKNQELQDNC